MNDLKRLRQCLEKERNLLTEALCGLSIVGIYIYIYM